MEEGEFSKSHSNIDIIQLDIGGPQQAKEENKEKEGEEEEYKTVE